MTVSNGTRIPITNDEVYYEQELRLERAFHAEYLRSALLGQMLDTLVAFVAANNDHYRNIDEAREQGHGMCPVCRMLIQAQKALDHVPPHGDPNQKKVLPHGSSSVTRKIEV